MTRETGSSSKLLPCALGNALLGNVRSLFNDHLHDLSSHTVDRRLSLCARKIRSWRNSVKPSSRSSTCTTSAICAPGCLGSCGKSVIPSVNLFETAHLHFQLINLSQEFFSLVSRKRYVSASVTSSSPQHLFRTAASSAFSAAVLAPERTTRSSSQYMAIP